MDRVAFFCIKKVPCEILSWILTIVLLSRRRGKYYSNIIEDYIFEQKHPILQIVFVTLHLIGHYFYYKRPFVMMPLEMQILSPIISSFFWVTYYLACFSDPGTITPANAPAYLAAYPHDPQMYPPNRMYGGRISNIPRVARSKWCRYCKRVVGRFDHHCAWLNTDVGANNYRWFILFLFAHVLICFLCSAFTVATLYDHALENNLWHATFRGPYGPVQANNALVFQYMFFKFNFDVALALITGCTAIVVAAFMTYHIWLAARNVTTNETHKLADHQHVVDWQIKNGQEPWPAITPIHRRGLIDNILEVAFPPALYGARRGPAIPIPDIAAQEQARAELDAAEGEQAQQRQSAPPSQEQKQGKKQGQKSHTPAPITIDTSAAAAATAADADGGKQRKPIVIAAPGGGASAAVSQAPSTVEAVDSKAAGGARKRGGKK